MALTTEQMDRIEKHITNSPYWERLNKTCKEAYKAAGKTPSEKEYQSLRSIIICKVIMEDQQVRKNLSSEVWEVLENAKQPS